jgi:hypothetical protein
MFEGGSYCETWQHPLTLRYDGGYARISGSGRHPRAIGRHGGSLNQPRTHGSASAAGVFCSTVCLQDTQRLEEHRAGAVAGQMGVLVGECGVMEAGVPTETGLLGGECGGDATVAPGVTVLGHGGNGGCKDSKYAKR